MGVAGAVLRISERGGGNSACGAVAIAGFGGSATTGAVGLGSTGLLGGEACGGSSVGDGARDFASIASTSARAVPYFSLDRVVTSCRRVAAAASSGLSGRG